MIESPQSMSPGGVMLEMAQSIVLGVMCAVVYAPVARPLAHVQDTVGPALRG